MKILLLLLLLFVCRVFLTTLFDEVEYGGTITFALNRRSQTVKFIPREIYLPVLIVWNRSEPKSLDRTRFEVVENAYFEIIRVTHRDNGIYTVLNERGGLQRAQDLRIYTPTQTHTLKTDESLYFSANVEKESCNIFFFPEGEYETQIVKNGRQMDYFNGISCDDFVFSEPCQLSNNNVQSSCNGRFEVRDEHGGVALKVSVKIQTFNPVYFAIGGFILVVILIICCARRFCCGRKSSSKKRAAASEPVVRHEYEQEPVGPRPNQLSTPSRTRYPAESSRSATGPLIHDPPAVNVPPGYSSVFTRAQESDGAVESPCSDPEPRFELKGLNFNFASPLSSDSTHCDVYTSDKLNFH